MRAIGYQNTLLIDDELSLIDIDLPNPEPTGRDYDRRSDIVRHTGAQAQMPVGPLETMSVRSIFGTADMAEQGGILNTVSDMVDAGRLRTTLGEIYGTINAANLRQAHAMIESGGAKGKIVLEGFY